MDSCSRPTRVHEKKNVIIFILGTSKMTESLAAKHSMHASHKNNVQLVADGVCHCRRVKIGLRGLNFQNQWKINLLYCVLIASSGCSSLYVGARDARAIAPPSFWLCTASLARCNKTLSIWGLITKTSYDNLRIWWWLTICRKTNLA